MNIEVFVSYIQQSKLDIDICALTTTVYELRNKDNGVTVSNIGGWQSTDFLPAFGGISSDPNFVNLVSGIRDATNMYHQKMEFKKTLELVIDNIWVNINGNGHSNESHVHPQSVLSGVFYLTDSATPISFVHPYPDINTYYWPENSIENSNKYNSSSYDILPEKNTLVLFPSWLSHKVLEHKSDNDRISISFNTKLQ
jgi:uncharacterized protein (TIGR02466 family)